MAMSTTTGGGLRAPLMSLVHVGGGVDRRTGYHEERAALREALERGTATINGDRICCRLWWSPCRRRASTCTRMPECENQGCTQNTRIPNTWQPQVNSKKIPSTHNTPHPTCAPVRKQICYRSAPQAMAARGVNVMRINTKYNRNASQILLKCRGIVQPW